jgi:C_GCAxxG_C_C family probable redox protein
MINIPVKDKRKGTTIMESRVEQAAERKMCGYNCAQAVACTYCDLAGIDEETVRNLTQGFAAGIGGSMEATCGAVIGAVNILGLINKNPQRTMQGSRKIINRFKGQNGTVICKELKGITDGVVKRECVDCVRDAAAFLEAELPENYVKP